MTYDIQALQDYSGDTAPEQKSGIAARGDYDDFRVTFEEFKAANESGWRDSRKTQRRAAGGEGRSHQRHAGCASTTHGRSAAEARAAGTGGATDAS
jgi:hypothetical protein